MGDRQNDDNPVASGSSNAPASARPAIKRPSGRSLRRARKIFRETIGETRKYFRIIEASEKAREAVSFYH